MNVEHYIAKDLDAIFSKFKYRLSSSDVKHLSCIAYEGIVSDEVMTVYELYVDNKPRYFGVLVLDHDDGDLEHTIEVFKTWASATEAKLLDRVEDSYLFELTEPFGIQSEE